MKPISQWLFWILVILTFLSCGTDPTTTALDTHINIRIANEPDRLNPMLSRQGTATEIERYIFSQLADYDPATLELRPVLLKERAKVSKITEGPSEGGLLYEMEILEEAKWDDGSPVTGYDYLFTMKAALNPAIANGSWRSLISSIEGISVDSANPKKFQAWLSTPYILGEEVVCGLSVYPEYIYDSAAVLRNFTFEDLKKNKYEKDPEKTTQLTDWANQFNSDRFSRLTIEGSGPYQFTGWQSGRQITLRKKENHWSANLPDPHPLLQAIPETVTYHIISDAQTSITNLKDGQLDIISDLTAEQFNDLKDYNSTSKDLTLQEAPILQYIYISYNNQQKILRDKLVRKAISHAVDMDEIIAKLFYGLGSRTIGPIHPSKSYYNEDLPPIQFDLEASANYLSEAGWNQGASKYRTKNLNGEDTQLELEILTTRSKISQDLAIILKENAAKIGIDIQIQPLEFRVLVQRVRSGDYDLACLSNSQAPGLNDPYNNWHSDNASSTGNNYCKFQNDRCDEVVSAIRIALDEKVRTPLYRTFQEIIYEEQPALFLVAPRKIIASGNRLHIKPSAIRPGYFANLARATE